MIIRVLSAGGDEIASAREDAYVHLVLSRELPLVFSCIYRIIFESIISKEAGER